jgi:hypothetical protein
MVDAVFTPAEGVRLAVWRRRLFLVMVAVLPLHTVFLSAWISWKPFLVALIVLALMDLVEGIRNRSWPWNGPMSLAIAAFFIVVLIGWPSAEYFERFSRLFLALGVGSLVLLVTERNLRRPGMIERTLRVVFWSGAAMALTGVAASFVLVGALGSETLDSVNNMPGVFRIAKPAYLKSGFVALSNWHQDPGYGAVWANLWAVLALVAGARRPVSGRWWLDGAVIGGLAFTVIMAFSRTGWLVLPVGLWFTSWLLVRKGWISPRQICQRLGIGVAVAALLLASVWLADVGDRGGDLELQFSFRFSQGLDLVTSITGLFEPSERFADAFDVSEERADVWPEFLDMFRERPWTGVGLSVGWQTNSIRQEPHNLVLELLAETGLVGISAFLVLLVLLLVKGDGVSGRAALLVSLLPFMTQTILFEPAWWFAGGLLLAGGTARPTGLLRAEMPGETPGRP